MCEIKFKYRCAFDDEDYAEMKFRGHCKSTEYCNGVSALMYTLQANVEAMRDKFGEVEAEFPEGEGRVYVKSRPHIVNDIEDAIKLYITVYRGLKLLEEKSGGQEVRCHVEGTGYLFI